MFTSKKSPTSERLNKLMFTISLLIGAFALLSGITAFKLGINNLGYYHSITFIIYLFCAYLSKRGRNYYSRIIFFILLNLGITITASFYGRAASTEYMFLFSLALPFSVFSFKTEKTYVYFFSFLSGFLWIALAITNFKLFTDTPIDIEIASRYLYPISVLFLFSIIITQLVYFSVLGTKYYSKIHIKRQEAVEASLAKSKFLSTMSHEIRTPLNAVIGLSHILGDNNPREDQKNNIEALNYSGKTLLSLLNNVLDFSKMQFTTIELDNIPTDIFADVKQIAKTHEAACIRKGITLKTEIDDNLPFVYIDIVRFSQVINNLVSNAIKFTDKGSVTLRIKKIKQTRTNVLINIEVKDTGIGIAKNKQKLIWEAFVQESSAINRIYGGTGLGLPIVKSIITVMGSKVKIRSLIGKGSLFSFRLKLKIADKEIVEKRIIKKEYNFNGKKVLLVDDNLINAMVGKQILEKEKLKVDVANDGLVAVNKVKEQHYDIVLMDIQMPIMDGYTATREIRTFNATIPILALSANVFSEIKDKIDECGMNGFIFKPFTPEDLLSQIEKFTCN